MRSDIEKGLEHRNCRRPDARGSLGQAGELQCHHQPNDRCGRHLPHAGRVRQHDVALQRLEVGRRDPDARQLAEPGVDSVDGLAFCDDSLDGLGTPTDRAPARRIERQRSAAIHGVPRLRARPCRGTRARTSLASPDAGVKRVKADSIDELGRAIDVPDCQVA